MDQTHPTVQEDTLMYQEDGRWQKILLDTPAWHAWLDTASTFTFRSSGGSFTARKERTGNKHGGWYWKAYRNAQLSWATQAGMALTKPPGFRGTGTYHFAPRLPRPRHIHQG